MFGQSGIQTQLCWLWDVRGFPHSVPTAGWDEEGCAGLFFWDELLLELRTLGLCCLERVDQSLVNPQAQPYFSWELFTGCFGWDVL